MKSYYEKNKAATARHHEKLDRITIWIPKEGALKQEIQAHAASLGESVNSFVLRAIRETIMRDQHGTILLDGEIPPAIQAYMDNRSR